MKRFFIFTYPKLTLYIVGIILAYFFFQIPAVGEAITSFDTLYLPFFFGGLLYSAGFTTPIATGFLIAYDTSSPLIGALIGGLGALIADLGIFSFIRLSFMDEFKRLKKSSFIKHISDGCNQIPKGIRTFLVYVIVVIVIASPLPDELAVAMLAGFTRVHPYGFASMSYIGNMLGIYILLSI